MTERLDSESLVVKFCVNCGDFEKAIVSIGIDALSLLVVAESRERFPACHE